MICLQEDILVAKKSVSSGVLFFKRLIAAVLALVILALAGLCVYFAHGRRSARDELAEAQDKLVDFELKEAAAEAERLRNALPPEQEKPAGEASAPEILAQSTTVAHALGSVEGVTGLNCLEGFREHYNAGERVFEVDLRMTADGYVVLRHDWSAGIQEGVSPAAVPTLEEFLAKPIFDQYTPLSFRDLLLLLAKYPDVCVITDTKLMDAESVTMQFRSMLDEAHALGLSYLFDRIIVQVYSPEHFSIVDGIGHFPHYIYTLYQDSFTPTEDGFRQKAIFCVDNGILGLTLNAEVWDPDFYPIANWRELKVFVHTVNDAGDARRLLRSGVSAVYSDTLDPADLEDQGGN